MNRRVTFSTLRKSHFEGRSAYRGEYTRFRSGKYVYRVPEGLVWIQEPNIGISFVKGRR